MAKKSSIIKILEDTYDKYLTKRKFRLINTTFGTIEFQRGDDDPFESTTNDIIYGDFKSEIGVLMVELVGDFNLQDFGMVMSYLNKVIPDVTSIIFYGNAGSKDIDEMIEDYFLEKGEFFFFKYKLSNKLVFIPCISRKV